MELEQGPSKSRKWLQRLVPLGVSVIALGALFTLVDAAAVWSAMSWRVVAVMVPAMLAYGAITLGLESMSLLLLIDSRPRRLDAWTAARIKCASYLLTLVHYALGVGALAVLLRRRARLSVGESASVVLLVSVTDLVLVLTLAAIAASLVEVRGLGVRAEFLIVGVVGFVGGIAVLRSSASLGPLQRLRELPVFAAVRKIALSRLLQLLGLRLVFCLTFIASTGAVFFAFDLEPGYALLVVGSMMFALVSALPIAVAGLGTGQVAFLFIFDGVADRETLLAASLILTASMISLRVSMGLVFAREFTREVMVATRSED